MSWIEWTQLWQITGGIYGTRDETPRPHRQLGIPPTTVLSGLLCIAHKPAAGFLCKESHAGPKRLVAVFSLACSPSSELLGC